MKAGKLLSPGLNAWILTGGPAPADTNPPVPRDFKPALGVAGGAPGLNTVLDMDGRRGRTPIVMCNDDPPMAEHTSKWILGLWRRVKD